MSRLKIKPGEPEGERQWPKSLRDCRQLARTLPVEELTLEYAQHKHDRPALGQWHGFVIRIATYDELAARRRDAGKGEPT